VTVHLNRLFPCRIFLAMALLGGATHFSRATEESGASPTAIRAGESYLRTLETAGAAYAAGQLSNALDKLDVCDQIHANVPDTWNMRGAIYADQHEYDKARAAFEKASELNPGDFWPQYNIAQLLLVQKRYPEAVDALKKLSVYKGHEELVAFKIVYADLMQGKMDDAKATLDAMKTPSNTPAYYFAQAAWSFANKDEKNGNYFVDSGMKIFAPEKCVSFYDALVLAGWVPPRNADGSYPEHDTFSALPTFSPAPPDVFPDSAGGSH
jgi:tetratricopeptide (TPR) repeat protein